MRFTCILFFIFILGIDVIQAEAQTGIVSPALTTVLPKLSKHDTAPSNAAADELGLLAYMYQAEKDQKPLPLRLYQPSNLPPEKVPLVVWLHGSGGGGNDNSRNLNLNFARLLIGPDGQKNGQCLLAFPQYQDGYNWWYQYHTRLGFQTAHAAIHTMQFIDDLCSNHPAVDPTRVYLIGFSQGSLAQSSWISAYANRFACSVQIGGSHDHRFLTRSTAVPIWTIYSTDDRVAMIYDSTPKAVRNINQVNPALLRKTRYEDAGHVGTLTRALKIPDLIEWMWKHRNTKAPQRLKQHWDFAFHGSWDKETTH